MVYSRYVYACGPYLYRSEREGDKVHSIYMGRAGNKPRTPPAGKPLEAFKSPVPKGPAQLGSNQAPRPETKKIKLVHMTTKETKLNNVQRVHLLALANKYSIDRAEIDHKLSYEENKEYLDRLAKEQSFSSEDRNKAEIQAQEWTGAYKEFIENVSEDSEKWKDYF